MDLHTIKIAETTFARIQEGQPLVVQGLGFPVEGVVEQDMWAFNFDGVGAIHVSTVEGRDVFMGNIGDTEVVVHHP